MKKQQKVGAALIRVLAVEAQVDPATIRKVLAGKPVRGMAEDRAKAALRKRGLIK